MSSPSIVPGQAVALSPRVRRVTQNNPGLMTGPGTNTYLIGRHTLFVLDPGEDTDEHFDTVMRLIGSTPVRGVAPSHAHPDHWPMAPRLARALGAPTFGYKPHNGYQPTHLVREGDVIGDEDWSLEVLYTPGHISDHVSYFLRQERSLFTGDHVMGWSTSVIARPDGNLTSYIASLERLRSIDVAVMYPAHGAPIYDAKGRVEELIAHRRMRAEQVVEALRAGNETVPAIVRQIYAGLDPSLHPAAQQSVLAHLEALAQSGKLEIQDSGANPLQSRYRLVD
jgi:glyoxylase-like metal-dependent hydrolase (beta-lactamase superfamily II)